jgi:MFS family permease
VRPTDHPFLALLRAPAARRMAASGFVARLREAGTGLAIVLTARQATGSYASAGLAVAAYLLGAAVSRPLHGRLVDRRGPRALLLPSFVNALALAALAVTSEQRAGEDVVLALAVAIGLTLPAISATLRSSWPRLVGISLDSAYAFDTVLYELSLVASPALVGLLATAAAPWAGLVLVAVAGMLGTTALVFAVPGPIAPRAEISDAGQSATSTPLEAQPSRKAPPLEGDRDGSGGGGDDVAETPVRPGREAGRFTGERALLSGVVARLVLVACFVGLAEGSLTVIVPAFATVHGGGVRGGLLLSALSIGSLIGATATGAVATRSAWRRRLAGASTALTLAFVVLAAVPAGPVAFGALLALVGAALAPALTAGFVALQREARAVSLTEAFTWASFAAAGGAAGGQALAGQLIAGLGVRTALWEPAIAAAIASALAVALVRPAWTRESKVRARMG